MVGGDVDYKREYFLNGEILEALISIGMESIENNLLLQLLTDKILEVEMSPKEDFRVHLILCNLYKRIRIELEQTPAASFDSSFSPWTSSSSSSSSDDDDEEEETANKKRRI